MCAAMQLRLDHSKYNIKCGMMSEASLSKYPNTIVALNAHKRAVAEMHLTGAI